jgi:hypothetical protein
MIIPAFSLPSNPIKNIQLREATVADAIDFADTHEDHNEEVVTLFLNRIQHKETFYDAKLWTAEDRSLALYWYWMHTTKDTELPLTYNCSFCGKSHTWLMDMRVIGENYRPIQGKPERDIECGGKKMTVHCLTGADMEALELGVLALTAIAEEHGTASAEYRKEAARLKLQRFLKLLRADEAMEKEILSMTSSDFSALVDQVAISLESMKHGLPDLQYDNHECYFLTPPHKCPEKEGETRLRVPFRMQDYIPRL